MDIKKKKILIVDDEEGFTEMVKFNLEAAGGYEVRTENKGAKALDSALEYRPDLILLDVIMPDAEGPDVVNQIRNNRFLKNTPVVFLTATIRKDEVDQEKGRVGGYAFLAKPGTIQELIECIEKQLASKN